jgi:hypothetical protein
LGRCKFDGTILDQTYLTPLQLKARDALSSLADVTAKYDADGIDVYFLNNKTYASNVRVSHIHLHAAVTRT